MPVNDRMHHARELLNQWRGDSYIFGVNVLSRVGEISATYGDKALIIATEYGEEDGRWLNAFLKEIISSLSRHHVEISSIEKGAGRDAPKEDVYRIALSIAKKNPDCVIAVGGGSTIDAVKVANAISLFSGSIEDCLPKGRISEIFENGGITPRPMIAVQTAAGSGAENTKAALVYDPVNNEKRIINDWLLLPSSSFLDYRTTLSSPTTLTQDGGIDALSHMLEEFMASGDKCFFREMEDIVLTGIPLVLCGLQRALNEPTNIEARITLGLAAGLGGYALMFHKNNPRTDEIEWGGTDCGHFHSYQIADYLTHGRSCGIINPYYMVLFANKIEAQNRVVAQMLQEFKFLDVSYKSHGRELALAVASGLQRFYKSIAFPISLIESGVPEKAVDHMVRGSRGLEHVLKNMPVPLELRDIDKYIRPTLEAAYCGDLIKTPSI